MKMPPPNFRSLMQVATELRVAGLSWQSIAQRVRRSPETCRHWLAGQDRLCRAGQGGRALLAGEDRFDSRAGEYF